MPALTNTQNKTHQQAMAIAKGYKYKEIQLIDVLQKVEQQNIHRAFKKSSLFKYGTEILGLDDGIVYALTTIARKAMTIPSLKTAIKQKRVTVSKVSRIVATLTPENADELIEFASTHTKDQIDFEMAKRNPRAKSRDRMKPLSEDVVEVKMTMSRATFEKLKRAESLQAQKNQSMQWGDVVDAMVESYLDKNDPVRKANRAAERKAKSEAQQVQQTLRYRRLSVTTTTLKAHESNSTLDSRVAESGHNRKMPPPTTREYRVSKPKRIPLTADEKHAVFRRDGGCCTHIGLDGKRCDQDKWLQIHHIHPVSLGGTNDPENLTTLCSFHHDLAHQLTLPIEGQVSWLRSPRVEYRVQ